MNYNEKFAKPGQEIMSALAASSLITKTQYDEESSGRGSTCGITRAARAHGASMMAPDYAHWHGLYEVAERFYSS